MEETGFTVSLSYLQIFNSYDSCIMAIFTVLITRTALEELKEPVNKTDHDSINGH